MDHPNTYFITWTTYGTWLPGDQRGWRKANQGNQNPQPKLENWSHNQMLEEQVLLNALQREKAESICQRHVRIRQWILHAISVCTNHVHLIVTTDAAPNKVRDQFKANATRVLHQPPNELTNKKIWTRGGDCEMVDGNENLDQVVVYVNEAQDRVGREK